MRGSRKMLIVEDDPEIRDLLRQVAQEAGYAVSTAAGLTELISTYATSQPDAVCLDLQLKDGNGIDVLRHLAEAGAKADIYIVSGFDRRVAKTAMEIGTTRGLTMKASLAKPFDIGSLIALWSAPI